MRPGGESLGYGEAVEAVAELADLEALDRQLSESEPGSTLDDVDVDTLETPPRLGAPPPTCRRCASWSASSSGRAT